MGKNKGGRDMADSAHQAVDKAKHGMDEAIDDVKGFNDRVEDKAKNMAGKTHDAMDKVKNAPNDMKRKATETADHMDKDIADKAMGRMDKRHS